MNDVLGWIVGIVVTLGVAEVVYWKVYWEWNGVGNPSFLQKVLGKAGCLMSGVCVGVPMGVVAWTIGDWWLPILVWTAVGVVVVVVLTLINTLFESKR